MEDPGTKSVSAALNDRKETTTKVVRSGHEIDKFWMSVVTEEPVSDELKRLVRADIEQDWYFLRAQCHRTNTKRIWTTIDDQMTILEDAVGKLQRSKWDQLCNKATAFYWLQSSQRVDGNGERTQPPGIASAALYDEWIRCNGTEPNIEYGHYFANPVRITSTGPSSIKGVIDAHLSLSKQAADLVREAQSRAKNIPDEQSPENPHNYNLTPLYHAIVLIKDHLDEDMNIEFDPDGFASLYKVARHRTVLIALTGIETGLSAPISLETLKGQSLPLERSDVDGRQLNVVRVSLAVAVQFIVDLTKREERAFEKPRNKDFVDLSLCPDTPTGSEDRRQICCNPNTWADANMVAAEKYGYDNISEVNYSIRRVQAAQIGEGFCEFIPFRWSYRWKE